MHGHTYIKFCKHVLPLLGFQYHPEIMQSMAVAWYSETQRCSSWCGKPILVKWSGRKCGSCNWIWWKCCV